MNTDEALRRLAEEPIVVLDVETSGLDWKKNYAVGYVLNFGPRVEDSHYIPVRHGLGGNFDGYPGLESPDGEFNQYPIEARIAGALRKRKKSFVVVGHNVSFDLRFMRKHGIDIPPSALIVDTMVNAALLDEFAGRYSLDFCARQAGVEAKKGTALYEHLAGKFGGPADSKQMANFWKLAGDDPRAVEYSIGDGITTYQLYEWQMREIEKQELSRVANVEYRLTRTLHRMTTRGIKVNESRLDEVIDMVQQELKGALTRLPDGFNTKSPKQVRELLEGQGISDYPRTEKGNPSFPEEYLKKHEVGRDIIRVRKSEHMINSFLYPMRDRHLFQGRVHTEFHQLRDDDFGTITGRLSSSNPNLQQAYKRNKELGKLFRSLFEADPGMLWRTMDYEQCEPTLLAYYSRCKVLLDGYRADPPIDAHTAVSEQANINRDAGKRLNQALITGAGRAKVRSMLASDGIPLEQADSVIDSYFHAMPEIKTLQRRASTRMKARGYIKSLLGRRSRLNDPRFAYKAMNRLLQCGNADILKLKMVEIDEELERQGDEDANLLNNVHDSLDMQFAITKEGNMLADWTVHHMQKFDEGEEITLDVPLRVDYGDGPDWSTATWGDEDAQESNST